MKLKISIIGEQNKMKKKYLQLNNFVLIMMKSFRVIILSGLIFNYAFGQNNEDDNFILNTNSIMRLTMEQ